MMFARERGLFETQNRHPVLVIFVGTFALDIPKFQERTCRDLVQLLLGHFIGDFAPRPKSASAISRTAPVAGRFGSSE
jgi:hypothetical protein